MKKLITRFFALTLTGSLALGLAACGDTAEKSTPADGGETVVTLTATSTLSEFEAAFEEANPGIDLQVEKLETGVIIGEMNRRLRNNHASDLITTNLPFGEAASYTYDLSAEPFVESYQSASLKSTSIDGQVRYLPLPGTYYGYVINKTLLDELGLPLPETSQDLLNILAAAKEQGVGVAPDTGCDFGLGVIGSNYLGAFFASDFATDILSTAEGAKWLAAQQEGNAAFTGTWENSITFIKTCIDNGYLDPEKLIVMYNGRLDSNANAFKPSVNMPERTAILTYCDLDSYEQILEKTEDEMVMLPCLPTDEGGNKLLSAVSNNYIAVNSAIAEDEAKLSAALAVLEYLSTEEGQAHWMSDTSCPYSYLNGYPVDTSALPEGIRSYAEGSLVFSNPFPTSLLNCMGKNLTDAAKGTIDIADALAAIDDYAVNGSVDADYDMSVVGTVSADMLYENSNTRVEETALGNFIADAVRSVTGADVALVNGGGIRSSLYAGDVTGGDLSMVCPYDNLIILAEMDGATLRAAIENGIQKTWKPAGQFLQVSGLCYSFKPAADESQTAELVSLTYADGTEVKDTDTVTVAYNNYMGGSQGYFDAGDGFTMLNVYDEATPITVTLTEETGKTYRDALKEYFAAHQDEQLSAQLEGRIEVLP